MRKLSLLFLFAFFLSALTTHADDLDTINKKLLKPEFLQAGFTQNKFLKILTLPLVSNGTFWISQKNGVVWLMEKPTYSQVVITPAGVSFSDSQNQRTAKSMEYVGKILQGLLSGDLGKINEQFTITVKNIGNTDDNWQIELEPKSVLLRKGIQSISMTGNTFIAQLILHEATGDRTEINFHDIQSLKTLPPEISNAFKAI
jgi:outer membrane lipoprotein-sorting protein